MQRDKDVLASNSTTIACCCFDMNSREYPSEAGNILYTGFDVSIFIKSSDAIIRRLTNLLGDDKTALVVDTTNGTQAHQIHPWGEGWCAKLKYKLLLYR